MTTQERAYSIWDKAGRPEDKALDCWLAAELHQELQEWIDLPEGNLSHKIAAASGRFRMFLYRHGITPCASV